jgi:manganese oxidase
MNQEPRRLPWLRRIVAMMAVLLAAAAALVELAEAGRPVAQTRSFTLYVRDGWLPTPDGSRIYVWGFTDDPNGPPLVPGPTIVVNEGDAVEIVLVNDRDPTASQRLPAGEGHTIHLHGLDVPTEHDGVPETHPPGLVRQGGSFTYSFVASHAGTYFYHCHQNNVEHQQMGMYGALIVRARDGVKAAYTGGPAYDREHTLVLAEMGAEGHEQARRAAQEGDDPYNWLRYSPTHFFVNDQVHTDTADVRATLDAEPGERVLARVINAGYVAHAIHAHGRPFRIVATDGRPWPSGPTTDTVWLGPGERYDLLFGGDEAGGVALHDHVDRAYGSAAPATGSPAEPRSGAGETRRFTLYVREGWHTMPDGARLYVYGFTDDPSGPARVPGPPISVNEGDRVEVTLVNDRDPIGSGHGLRIHVPGVATDGPALVQPGGSQTYRFAAGRAGSYLYTGHSERQDDQQMGMYGALLVKPGGGQKTAHAGGPAFDRDYTMVLSEMDAAGHDQTRRAAHDGGPPFDWQRYAPNYFLINGLAYPDTEQSATSMVHALPGERILIRAINAGRLAHAMHLHGFHFKLVAVDGSPWPDGPSKDTVLIGPGQSYDLLFVADQAGLFPFHDHFETANTNNGLWLGGMHTMVAVGAAHHAPAPAPPPPQAGQAGTVFVRDNFYAPNQLTVPVGATVRWEHQGKAEHTVSSLLGSFDSGVLAPGAVFSHTFTAPGRYEYFCRFHITNRGTITVQ